MYIIQVLIYIKYIIMHNIKLYIYMMFLYYIIIYIIIEVCNIKYYNV